MSKELMLELWCELDDTELLVRGQMLGAAVSEFELVEQQKKDAMKAFKDQLDLLWLDRVRLSGVIKRKAETRMVNCAVEFHVPVAGTKRITRLDTGEFVRDEPMSAAEHQGNLFQVPAASIPSPSLAEAMAKDESGHLQALADRQDIDISIHSGSEKLAEIKPRGRAPKAN